MKTEDIREAIITYRRFVAEHERITEPGKNRVSNDYIQDYIINLHRYECELSHYAEYECNGELTKRQTARRANVETMVKTGAAVLGFGVTFNGDPRGACIRFRLPSGRSNNMDGETWAIYY